MCNLSCGITVLQMASFAETKYICENASLELASLSFVFRIIIGLVEGFHPV